MPMDIDEQSSPKLAYSSTNYALHAHIESLSKLLLQLDGVQSWGQASVRDRRKGVVKEIEGELARIERYWKAVWRDHVLQRDEDAQMTEQ